MIDAKLNRFCPTKFSDGPYTEFVLTLLNIFGSERLKQTYDFSIPCLSYAIGNYTLDDEVFVS